MSTLVVVAALVSVEAAEDAEEPVPELPDELLEELPSLTSMLWDTDLTLRTWAGYNDNPRLSSLNPVGAGFVGGGAEFLAFRLPADGREVTLFAIVEHLSYIDSEVEPETFAAMDGRFRRIWESGFSLGVGIDAVYLRQVFDASEISGIPAILRAEGQSVGIKPVVGIELGRAWSLELELEGTRQWLAEPLDSFWDSSAKLTATRRFEDGEAGGSYRYVSRIFDTRVTRAASGAPLDGSLRFTQHELEIFWLHRWGAEDRWRSTLRTGFLRSLDNGHGFYDYDRVHLSGVLRYAAPEWEVRAEARMRWYTYPVQFVDALDPSRRRRTDLNLSLRGEYKIYRGTRLFAEYAFETSDENVIAADYHAQKVHAGLSIDL